METKANIRFIRREDNAAIGTIIKNAMTEFGADPKTTVLADESINNMFETYQEEGAVYFVAEEDSRIMGGAGIRKLDGSTENICELQRMFLVPEARGKGLGLKLLQQCLVKAKESGYRQVYLESLSGMYEALRLYKSSGFEKIGHPLGSTGHTGCNVFMKLDI